MTQAFIITLREGLEAFLIVAISLAYLRKTGRPQLVSAVHWGIAVAIALSVGAAVLFQQASNQALWEGILGLTAAAVSTSYCATSVSGPPSLVPNLAKVNSLTQAQKEVIFQIFQSPKPISPAYGGAKIHKVLDEAVQNIHASGDAFYADMTHADVLAVVDSQYKGGKYTFKQKYEEWLVKKHGALPSPDPIPSAHVDSVTPPTVHPSAPTPAVDPTPTPPTVPHVSDPPPPPKTNKGYTPLGYLSGDITGIPLDVQAKVYTEFKKNKVTAIWSGNKIYESVQKTHKALHAQGIYLNDHEVLQILDIEAGKSGASTGFVVAAFENRWGGTVCGSNVEEAGSLKARAIPIPNSKA